MIARLGRRDEAFVWLKRAVDERDPAVIRMKIEPVYDELRSDQRFTDLLRRMNLTQ
jgi:hypothetical protein